MKRTDLEKLKGAKLTDGMGRSPIPDRFGKDSAVLSRREQRKIDQAMGLVPFAVKIESALVQRIQTLAQERNASVNEVVTELLKKGLDG